MPRNARSVRPYWPGRGPDEDEESSDSSEEVEEKPTRTEIAKGKSQTQDEAPAVSVRGGIVARRPEFARLKNSASGDDDDAYNSEGDEDDDDEEEEDEEEEDGDEDESESQSHDEDADDYPAPMPMLKPVFVSKSERVTIAEREEINRREREAAEKARLRERQAAEEVRNQVLATATLPEEPDEVEDALVMPDDEDRDEEADEEFEKWRIRELKRIVRDRTATLERQEAERELERRRNMSPEEREKEDKERARRDDEARKTKTKMAYLQKYYHKGAFFMEADPDGFTEAIYNRDFMQPTDEEKFDKTLLAKPMQVRKGQLGMAGRSKYTHLLDQDTTRLESDPLLRRSLKKPRNSMHIPSETQDPLARPKGKVCK